MTYKIDRLVVTDLQENCYIVHDHADAVVIDPGETKPVQDFLKAHHLTCRLILNTHGHIDHICGNLALKNATGAGIAIGREDAVMLTSPVLCGATLFGFDFAEHNADTIVNDGDKVGYGSMQFEAIATPGHSPGSRSYLDRGNKVLFSGDLVFLDAVGRWDVPGANREDLFESLKRFLTLPDDIVVYPGHGPSTTVGRERRMNPFLQELA